MTIRRVSMMAAAVSFVWTLPLQEASAQSVVGAGTVPIIKIGQGVGAGAPQGNFTAAAHSVHGIPVGAARVRFPGFAVATVEVDCLHVDGNRAVVGGPIRTGSAFLPAFTHLYLVLEDNGTPVRGEGVDRALVVASNLDLCDIADVLLLFLDFFDPVPVSHGNYTIREDK